VRCGEAYSCRVGRLGLTLRRVRPVGLLSVFAGVPFACSTHTPEVSGESGGTAGSAIGAGTAGAAAVSGAAASGTAGSLASGGTTFINPDAGPGTPDTMGLGGEGGGGGEETCAGESHPAETAPIDMYLMLDRSLSMKAGTSTGDSKWEAITDALEAFVSDPSSEGMGVGIQFFPANLPCTSNDDCGGGTCYLKACRQSRSSGTTLPGLIPCVKASDCPASGDTCEDLGGCGDQSCVSVGSDCNNGIACTAVTSGVCASQTVCTLSDYTTPVVPIGTLPGNQQQLVDTLHAYEPSPSPFGLTPTGPALQGAITYAQEWGAAHPDRKAIVVLATDGAPTGGCSPSRRAEIAALASVGAGAKVPVLTYTIGVFSPEDPENPSTDSTEGPANIRAIASAGKGDAFVLSDQRDVTAQFIDALNSVRGHGLSCEFRVPESEDGKEVDYGKVNVEFTPKAGEEARVIPYLDDAALCDTQGGWYYVTDPASGTPRGIVACGATCDQLMGSVTGKVNIRVGCATVRRDPVE